MVRVFKESVREGESTKESVVEQESVWGGALKRKRRVKGGEGRKSKRRNTAVEIWTQERIWRWRR